MSASSLVNGNYLLNQGMATFNQTLQVLINLTRLFHPSRNGFNVLRITFLPNLIGDDHEMQK